MKALYVVLIIIAIAVLLYIVYRNTIGRKTTVSPIASTRNSKDLSQLTFLEANNFTPNVQTFTFQR